MADEPKRSRAKPAIGLVGAVAAIVGIWWFALRPGRHRGEGPTGDA